MYSYKNNCACRKKKCLDKIYGYKKVILYMYTLGRKNLWNYIFFIFSIFIFFKNIYEYKGHMVFIRIPIYLLEIYQNVTISLDLNLNLLMYLLILWITYKMSECCQELWSYISQWECRPVSRVCNMTQAN